MKRLLMNCLLMVHSASALALSERCLKDWKEPLELTLHTNSKGLQSIALETAPGGKRVYTDDDGLLTMSAILSARSGLNANLKAQLQSRWSEARERLLKELDEYAKFMEQESPSAMKSANPSDPPPMALAAKARSALAVARGITPQWSDEAASTNAAKLTEVMRTTAGFMGYCSFSVDANYGSPQAMKFANITPFPALGAIENSKLSALPSFPPAAEMLMSEKEKCQPSRYTLRIDTSPATGPVPADGQKSVN